MAKKMAARKLFHEAEEAMEAAQDIIYGPDAGQTGDAERVQIQDDTTPAPSRRCDDNTVFVSRSVQDRLDDSESRQEKLYEQLARQQLFIEQMAATQATTNEMLSQLQSAVARLPASASVPASASDSAVRNDTDGVNNASGPALQQGTAALQQGTAAAGAGAAPMEQYGSASDFLPASDVRHAADADINASAGNATHQQGTAAAEPSAVVSAASCLQLLLRFKDHDPPMFSDSKLRWTTNGPSMYGHIRLTRVALCDALEAAIEHTGAGADKAIQAFVSAVTSWLTPRDHSVTSILMEGLTYDQDSAAAADVNRLVILSVLRYKDIVGLAAEIEDTGRYDRSLCKGVSDIRMLPGYREFDPSTAEGSLRWTQLRKVISAFFKIPVSAVLEKEAFRQDYMCNESCSL